MFYSSKLNKPSGIPTSAVLRRISNRFAQATKPVPPLPAMDWAVSFRFMRRLHQGKRKILGIAALIVAARVIGMAAAALPADFVITNANVLTVDKNFSRAEALAVRGDKIIAIGRNRKIASLIGANTRVVDAHGRTV